MPMFYSASERGFFCSDIHTEMPADAVAISDELHQSLMAEQSKGKAIVPGPDGAPRAAERVPTAQDLQAGLTARVQQHLDAAAKALGYDDIKSAVTYADEPAVPRFQAEGLALRAWRSQVWAACYAILAEVQAGARTVPTASALIAELPPFVAPSA